MATKAEILFGAKNATAAAFAQIQRDFAALSSRASALNSAFTRLSPVLGSALAGAGLLAGIKRTIDGLDALNDAADATGASIESLSAIEDVALRTGTSFETATSSIVKLNQALNGAKAGSEQAEVFKALGLSVEELKRADPAEALLEVAKAFGGFADDGNKARAAQLLFGKSLKEVAPLLKDLAEKGQLNATVTKQQAEEAERFNKSLFELEKNATDAARSLTGPMIGALNETITKFKEGSKAGKSFFQVLGDEQRALLRRAGEGLGIIDPPTLEDRSSRFTTGSRRPANEGGGKFLPQLNVPQSDKTKKAQSEAERYLETLQKQGEKTRELNTYEQALLDIQKGRIEGLTPKLREQILAQAKFNDTLGKTLQIESAQQTFLRSEREGQAAAEKALGDARLQSYEEARRAAEQFFDATRTPQEQLNAEIAEQDRLLRVLGDTYENTYNRAVGAAFERFDRTFKDQKQELSEFNKNLISGTQNVLADSLETIGTDGFRNLDRKFSDLLLRLSAQAVAADLTEKLFGKDGKGLEDIGRRITEGLEQIDFSSLVEKLSSSLGGIANSIAGLFSGGGGAGGGVDYASLIGSVFGGAFAEGGFAQPNKAILVGEEGPELMWSGSRGATVQPMAPAGPSKVFNINVTAPTQPGMSRETALQQGAAFGAGIQRAIARNG